ncbi:MAG: LCP family protein [Patescibacteria group bacterium]
MPAINKKQKTITSILLIITLLTSVVVTVSLGRKNAGQSSTITQHDKKPNYPESKTPNPEALENLKTLNILLLGYGGAGHDGGYLTDVIQVLHINFAENKLRLISIPRDLWVTLPNGKSDKINHGFTLDGGQTSKTMAEVVTGLKIHYFLAIDFVGFKKAIGENLDGIEVDVPETLDDPWYPIKGEELNTCGMSNEELEEVHVKFSGFELERQFECRYEQVYFEKGEHHMEGGDALKYVRSRHGSAAGDFSRSQRQAVILKAAKNKLLSLEALDKSVEFFAEISQLLSSDIDTDVVRFLTPGLKSASQFKLETLVLSTDNAFVNSKSASGQFILLPKEGQDNWDQIHKLIETRLK